jgi:hypothetical protein
MVVSMGNVMVSIDMIVHNLKEQKYYFKYNQQDATFYNILYYCQCSTCFGRFSTHHQELIKLYVQPWVLSCFPAVYRWCE